MLGNAQRTASLAVLVVSVGARLAATAPPASSARPAAAAFERFKALAGEWVAAEDGDMVRKGTSWLVTRSPRTARRSWRRSFPARSTRW